MSAPPDATVLLPIAHVGHYLWIAYIPPALIVLWSIGRSVLEQRRGRRDEDRTDEKSDSP
jgi:hypothetical protein